MLCLYALLDETATEMNETTHRRCPDENNDVTSVETYLSLLPYFSVIMTKAKITITHRNRIYLS